MCDILVKEENTSSVKYTIDGHEIVLDKALVDSFSSTVCPISENYLSGAIGLFGRDAKDDRILSYVISADMAQDLYDYAQ